jgi:hypothetical protein
MRRIPRSWSCANLNQEASETHAESLHVLPNDEAFSCFILKETAGKPATIRRMNLTAVGMRVLEVLFFCGLVGSAVVVIISFIEDGKELFGDE